MKSKRYLLIILILSLLLLVLSNCSKKTTEPVIPADEPIIADETVVIPPATAEEIIEITEDKIVFPEGTDASIYEVGNVICSGITDKAPYGFLRKVVSHSTQGGQVVVNTAPARLEDAFDQLDLNITQDLKTSDLESSRALVDGIEIGRASCRERV